MNQAFTADQLQYIEEVLGYRPFGHRIAPSEGMKAEPDSVLAPPPPVIHDVLVLTHPLDQEQRALLEKILASIKLSSFEHLELESIELGHLPEGIEADHVLVFTEGEGGQKYFANSPWWILPTLSSMIGANAVVAARKKEAWNWLQQFAKDRA